MEDWKERLLEEQRELKEKLVKLTEFINSERYYTLSVNNRLVLKNQKMAMELYLSVLNMRAFEDVDNITVPDHRIFFRNAQALGYYIHPITYKAESY
jgi:hypothetical protein